QGVVTYSAVVDVANPELELRPGMTATVTIETRRVEAAVSVPNAALRFRPVAAPEAGGPPGAAAPAAAVTTTELRPGQGRVYQRSAGGAELEERVLDLGITDGKYTEVRGGLAAAAEVVTEQRDAKKPAKVFGLF
ncbi:MAG: efflux RND transporter periplasmic adaptor subunit, partial [Deltaproteobacteria bacterium]|nr:efflux RND transporter periplasmic adaptor subunit [Deltaproteobacteria bacterium]